MTTTAELRQAVAAAIAAIGDPWAESAWAYDTFPRAEGAVIAHGMFAVGVPSSVTPNALEGSARKRGDVGGLANTRVMVRFLWGIRAESAVADFDAGLEAEDVVRVAVLGITLAGHISIARSDRMIVGDGTWLLVTLEFATTHRLVLE
jgi:hypothetical protein